MASSAYDDLISQWAATYGLPFSLVKAIVQVESGFDPNAENLTGGDAARGGSYGLMQVSLETAQGYGYDIDTTGQGLLDPSTNLQYGCMYLADCYSQAAGDIAKTAAAYNGSSSTGSYATAVLKYNAQFSSGSGSQGGGLDPVSAGLLVLAAGGALWAFSRV